MKRYMISIQLDVEVDYFITKIDNARFDAQPNNDFDLLDSPEEKFARLLELEEDLIINGDGVFTVSSKNYLLAKECRDAYRLKYPDNFITIMRPVRK